MVIAILIYTGTNLDWSELRGGSDTATPVVAKEADRVLVVEEDKFNANPVLPLDG